MKRRAFIQSAAATGAAVAIGLPHIAMIKKKTFRIGLQLFSVRDAIQKDPIDTLKKLKTMGYQDFETYGFDAQTNSIYGYSTKEFKSILEDLGLSTTSGHYGFTDYFEASSEALTRYVDSCIEAAHTFESPYLTWPFVNPEYRNGDGFKRLSALLNQIGEQLAKANLGFAYHNHGYEFENWTGETGFEILMKNTDPELVKLQMDMYWVVHSGQTPQKLIEAQPGRFVMWHIKDMDKVTRDYTELGKGSIDYTTLIPDPELSGLEYYYLEQGGNFAVNSMQSAQESIDYFKANLAQYL